MLKKVFKMALTIFLIVFVVGMLLSNNDSGQMRPAVLPRIIDSNFVAIPPSILQSVLIDSIGKQEQIKKQLAYIKDSMTIKIADNRRKVIKGVNDIISKKPDTVYMPMPPHLDNIDEMIYNLN